MSVSDSQIDQESPIDATLMAGLVDMAENRGILYRWGGGGSYYVDAADALITPVSSYSAQAAGTTKSALTNIQILIPSGVTRAYLTIKAGCSRTNADAYYRVVFDGNNLDFASLPSIVNRAWQTAQYVDFSGAGWKNLSVSSVSPGGATPNYQLDGLIIYTAA